MLRINQLKLPVSHKPGELTEKIQRLLGLKERPQYQIVRRSIDARKKPELYFNYVVDVKVPDPEKVLRRCRPGQAQVQAEKEYGFPVEHYQGSVRPVIIGTGPAGLFCGYMLAEAGFSPILLERGRPVEERSRDVERFWETGSLHTESNVQFGEGGAGTFSDGKLNTLVKDKYGRNKKVLSVFVKEGAPEEILYDYKPHIGTDVLTKVIKNMREHIISCGGEVRFGAKVTGLLTEQGRIKAVCINERESLKAEYVALAPGHSARDTFQMLYDMGMEMEARPFAVGFRVEHPQSLINFSQYGREEISQLGNAPYKVTARAGDGRGVYSFCMCPGGYVVNASSEEGRLAVNGMSYSGRNGTNANSAIIVTVTPKDYGDDHPLSGVKFQRELEERAFRAGEGGVPVERYGDFKRAVMEEGWEGKRQGKVPETGKADREMEALSPAIKGKWRYGPVHTILPKELNRAFVEGMEQFGREICGFDHDRVLVEGIESRTSSPVRMMRDDTLQSAIRGLYPCGEGAGYAGGITSAAMDGIRVAEQIALCIAGKEDMVSQGG